jgi:hypothetical protein
MALGMLALLTGLWGGLARVGWPLPQPMLLVGHGPLMVAGFLGTLIGLERAVALSRVWGYAGPALTGVGAVALMTGLYQIGATLMIAGSAVLVLTFAVFIRRQPALFAVTMGLGAVCLLVGNSLWLIGQEVFSAVSWWMGFPILTIAGERLELSRLVQVSRESQFVFLGIVGVLLAGLTHHGIATDTGARLSGLALIALAGWFLRHDVARRTIRQPGLPRFTAVCLLSGYVWLGVAGALALSFGGVVGGLRYDAVLHAVFLGFVFAMIFGHAPIIFPAILGLAVPFRRGFYAQLVVLHGSLLLRVGADLIDSWPLRRWGGLLNAVAVLLFLANTMCAVIFAKLAQPKRRSAAALRVAV